MQLSLERARAQVSQSTSENPSSTYNCFDILQLARSFEEPGGAEVNRRLFCYVKDRPPPTPMF